MPQVYTYCAELRNSYYYHPSHKWCGLEWAAMDMLSNRRLSERDSTAIIPVLVRKSHPLPQAVARIQYIDLSKITTIGSRYYRTKEYRLQVLKIVERIEEIAVAIAEREAIAGCEQYEFPSETAFPDYELYKQPFPLRMS